jgi:ribosomal protein S13
MLAEVKAGTLTLGGVLGRNDDLARKTKVAQVVRALPGVGKARAAAVMERAGIPAERRVGGLGARQREQLLAEFVGE